MKKLLGTSAIVLCFALTGCGENKMYTPPTVTQHHVQLEEEHVDEVMLVSEVEETFLKAVAQHHRRYSDGAVDVLVMYDPRSYKNTAMKASEAAAHISSALRKNGVDEVEASILPINALGDEAKVSFRYNAYNVAAPADCEGSLPGLYGDAVEDNRDYKIGCSVKTLLAKQVVRSADLKGRGQTDMTTEGRAAANVVDYVRSGARNEALEGESTTDN